MNMNYLSDLVVSRSFKANWFQMHIEHYGKHCAVHECNNINKEYQIKIVYSLQKYAFHIL